VWKVAVKGSGLGLAIVKRIVELHGGEVGADDSLEGKVAYLFCCKTHMIFLKYQAQTMKVLFRYLLLTSDPIVFWGRTGCTYFGSRSRCKTNQ
jgi:signal transduction histidine kinase